MFLADQRFRNFPGNATVEEGKLLNLTVCYLKHLPESPNLSTVTLVEEATGNTTIANLDRTDYCAHFSLENSQPGTYHFEVTHVHYGTINSRSFHIGMLYVSHTHTHARMHTQSHRHRNMHTHTHRNMHTHTHTHTQMRSNTIRHTHIHTYTHAYSTLHACIYTQQRTHLSAFNSVC